ncbi:MAG: DUF1015 domain-containing protein [Clostridia bacterium]|nr:DUF1015 domain-containing protein [Clostridia bacterium]
MATIKPFKALRFTESAGKIQELVCPPYDIISEEERLAYIKTNPHNIIRLELPREGEDFYKKAGEVLADFEKNDVLKTDDTDSIYVYEIGFKNGDVSMAVKGIICRVELSEFSKGIVLPHEETLSKAKVDRFNLMNATNCNFSQIYSLYMDEQRTTDTIINNATSGAADIEFVDGEGLTQRLWIIKDAAVISEICDSFKERKLYIADGHHRYETALNYRNHCRENGAKVGDSVDYVMMMLVSMEHEGLLVLPTHRIVRDLESFDKAQILEACEEYFDIEKFDDVSVASDELAKKYEQGKKSFALYTGESGFELLTLKDESVMKQLLPNNSAAYQQLDVNVLHILILEKLFGIDKENMANQKNLTYTKFFDEAILAVKNGSANCSFILNPTRVSEIRDVAGAGEKMPQKSTYFYPKLITGLVMNKF